MRKSIIASLAIIALVLLTYGTAAGSRSTRIHNAYNSVVAVYADVTDDMGDTKPDQAICSGFVARSNGNDLVIVTARHCVALNRPTHVEFKDGEEARVLSSGYSPYADTAMLHVRSAHHHPALILTRKISAGDPLYVLGMPSGDEWSFSSAYSRNGDTDVMSGSYIFYAVECVACFNGDSGGPVINENEEVVGTVSQGGDPNTPGVILITPSELIQDMLAENK